MTNGSDLGGDAITQNKRTVQRLFDEVWNARRIEVIPELYSPDFVADYRPYAHCGTAGRR